MKKQILKFLTMGILAVIILILNTNSINIGASRMSMSVLKKYNTNEIIRLRNKPLEIPNYIVEKKEQFRGVWVSTVYNLDFPSKAGITEKKYKDEYIKLLDNLEELNMNSVIFQVRPKLDTFYKSDINPWSEYLTGVQGKSPGWDPMKWMVEETHKRDMEFHAWFNPYRVTTVKEDKKGIREELKLLNENNWARKHPEYVYRFDGRLYLNPGEPEVIDYINKSVMEVVENYDIDAVHFDDYFYPFKRGAGWYFTGENNSFKKYKGNIDNVADWRRNNVDNLVENLHKSIREYNKREGKGVQFGISPFGIWGHQASTQIVSRGIGSYTPTTSSTSFDNQFADTRKWVKNNWVDYIAPQIYWTFDQKEAPYGELVHWWADVVKGTDVQLYIGHANYKINESDKDSSWKNPEELCNQLKFNSKYDEIKGSIFFRYKNLLKTKANNTENDKFIDMLKSEYFKNKANVPEGSWLANNKTDPLNLKVVKVKKGNVITWKDSLKDSFRYVIYRETLDKENNPISKVKIKMVEKVKDNKAYGYLDKDISKDTDYKYSIVALNKYESKSKVSYNND